MEKERKEPRVAQLRSVLPMDQAANAELCKRIEAEGSSRTPSKEELKLLFSVIDLTTLEATDTHEKVRKLCAKAEHRSGPDDTSASVAAVCVYPTLVRTAKEALRGTVVKIASVAGAFPSGQSPLHVKLAEVKFAIEEGADEIDMVISRGKFLEGDLQFVFDEIAAIKEICGGSRLKVILETGELQSLENIRSASDIAIAAGADFIKTSTGKAPIGAALDAVIEMVQAIRDHLDRTGRMVGIKPSGGIRRSSDALRYLLAVKAILGDEWLDPKWFRLGASSLLDDIFGSLTGK